MVDIIYDAPDGPVRREVAVVLGQTFGEAIAASGLLVAFPAIRPFETQVGSYGVKKTWDTKVEVGDRIEIYRPLTCDPKTLRNQRDLATRKPRKT